MSTKRVKVRKINTMSESFSFHTTIQHAVSASRFIDVEAAVGGPEDTDESSGNESIRGALVSSVIFK